MNMPDADEVFEQAFQHTVEFGNSMAESDKQAHPWDISDGLLAGAIQYWLFAHQPCGDPLCEDCAPVSTAENRLKELQQLVQEYAEESQYFHSPNDTNVGRA
jgi:hypothetical protein